MHVKKWREEKKDAGVNKEGVVGICVMIIIWSTWDYFLTSVGFPLSNTVETRHWLEQAYCNSCFYSYGFIYINTSISGKYTSLEMHKQQQKKIVIQGCHSVCINCILVSQQPQINSSWLEDASNYLFFSPSLHHLFRLLCMCLIKNCRLSYTIYG